MLVRSNGEHKRTHKVDELSPVPDFSRLAYLVSGIRMPNSVELSFSCNRSDCRYVQFNKEFFVEFTNY